MPQADVGRPAASLEARVRHIAGPPIVAVRVWLRGGTRAEPLPGVACACGRLLVEGTANRDWRAIAGAAEDRGMVLSSTGTLEAHGVAIDALAQDWEIALEWAAELVLESAFPTDRGDWVRRQLEAELEGLADQPEVRTAWGFLAQLYDPHPAGRSVLGTPAGLHQLGMQDCRRFHDVALERGGVVAVAGDVPEAEVALKVEELFLPLAGKGGPLPSPPPPSDESPRRRVVALPMSEGAEQAHLYLGHRTVARSHPDYRALELAGVVLGASSGLSGRIPERVREREGLAYTAHAHTVSGAGLDPGRLTVYLATSPSRAEQAERAAKEEIERFLDAGLTDDELESARTYLLRREAFQRETARQWADLLAESLFYDLPVHRQEWVEAELRALDRQTVEAAARRHLSAAELRVTLGLPSSS